MVRSLNQTVGTLLAAGDSRAQWEAYYSAMVEAVPGLKGSASYAFQFTNPELTADWYRTGDSGERLVIDRKPASSGPFYNFGDTLLSQNYGTFLFALNVTGDRTLDRARMQYLQAEADNAFPMSVEGDLGSDFTKWKYGGGNPLSIVLSENQRIINEWNVVGGGTVQLDGFILSGRGEALDRRVVDQNYRLGLHYQAVKQYPIQRGLWWNGSILEIFKHAEYFSPIYTKKTFFGDVSGLLNLVPVSVVVVYQPSLTLTITESVYEEFKVDLEVNGECSFGPYKVNGNVQFKYARVNKEDHTVTVSYDGTVDEPILLGVFSVPHVAK